MALAFAALLIAAAVNQHHRQRQVAAKLAEITPRYDVALRQTNELAQLQSQLDAADDVAQLFTYLRNPWPRTQLLAALLAPLPKEIRFSKVEIRREEPQLQRATERRSRAEIRAEQQQTAELAPAARDLKTLREQFDDTKTVVLLEGITTDSAAVHRYLGELNQASLFTAAEPDSIDAAPGGPAGSLQFRATVTVLPGYGLPGGPTAGGQTTDPNADSGIL